MRYADEQYGNFSAEEKEKVRRIFIQLVRPGEGTEDTRRTATKAELGAESWFFVKQLADARLVVTSRDASGLETVEVVHEALIRNWGELREWMNADRDFRGWQERLRGAKRQWEATDKDAGSLLRGAALAEAEERLKERVKDLGAEAEFIEESLAERDRLEREKTARRRREMRTAWGIAAGSLVAVVVSSGLGWMAWNKTKEADFNLRASELNLADSWARTVESLWNENRRDLDTLILALKAGKILQKYNATDPEVIDVLSKSRSQTWERNRLAGHQNEYSNFSSVSFSPDGKTLASGSKDDTIKLWNFETGAEIRTLTGHQSLVHSVSFSPDGKTLASASSDSTIKLWNIETGAEIRTLTGHQDYVDSVSFSPDGKTLASASSDNTIKLWNVETGAEIRTLTGHQDYVNSVSFSPDGKTLASASSDNTIKLWYRDEEWDLDTLMERGCNLARNYLTHNPDVSKEDRHLCDGIGTKN